MHSWIPARRIVASAAVGVMLGVLPPVGAVRAASEPPPLHSGAAVLMDAATGRVLYGFHAYRQMDPASITKIMTAYLVIRAGHLNRVVGISRRAALEPGSRMQLHSHDRFTILDLLRGLLLRSGNDAAIALAEAESGSVDAFVAEMNRAAHAMGAYQTHFQNPNGLTQPGHYSSAYDLALIARVALREPLFQHLVSTPEDRVTELTSGKARTIYTTNRLLETFPPADGIKTGTTAAAGRCLAASATKDGMQLIAVVLRSQDRWQAATSLLRWGFANWHAQQLLRRNQVVARVLVQRGAQHWLDLVPASPLSVAVRSGTSSEPGSFENAPLVIATHPTTVTAPVRRGQVVGSVRVFLDGALMGVRPLVAKTTVARHRLTQKGWRWPWPRR